MPGIKKYLSPQLNSYSCACVCYSIKKYLLMEWRLINPEIQGFNETKTEKFH